MKRLLIVSKNKYKKQEFKNAFDKYLLNTKVVFRKLDFNELCSMSQISNLKSKILFAYKRFKEPVLVDDTCVFIKKYRNFPGVHNKWLIDSIGIKGLLKLVNDNDKALFRCCLGFYNGKFIKIFKGEISGRIKLKSNKKQFMQGLEYSTIFIPDGMRKPMAELYKYNIMFNSHRMKAIKKFILFFKKYYANNQGK